MAVSKSSTQVTWPTAANSASVSSGGNATSEAGTFATDSFEAMLTCKADNGGTPAAGDTVDFYLLYTTGDPDGASTDEYDTNMQGTYLCTLDTNADDPAQKTVRVSPVAKGFKVYAVNNASSNSITVAAELYEASA